MRFFKLLTACAACALLLFCAACAEVFVEAEIGYENAVTFVRPIPLRVSLRNDGPDADLTVAVNLARSDREYDRCEYPVTLAGGAQVLLTLPVRLTYKQPAFTVEVLREGEIVAQTAVKPQKTISPETLLVGLLSSQPQSLRYLNINEANDQLMRDEYWQTLALTAETFPDSPELMRAFRILAVDDFDMTALSDSQRDAFDQWLRQGGIVIAGGGSSGVSTFKGLMRYTGIITGTPRQAEHIDKALLTALAQGQFAPSGQSALKGGVMLSELRGSRHAVAELNGAPLLDRCPVGQGVIYTAAFSLSERPLSAWNGMSGLWQRVLLTFDRALYQRTVQQTRNYYDEQQGIYVDQWLLRQLPLENPDNVLLLVLLIAGFAVLSGIGSNLILKKLDKREWMWLTVPALSLLCAALVLAVSRGMLLGRPTAAAYARVQVAEDGTSTSRVMAGVASASREPIAVALTSGESFTSGNADYAYYDYDVQDEQREITPTLRFTYTYGDRMTLTMPAASPWTVQSLCLNPESGAIYPIRASVWWEQDGLHGRVENGTDLTLESGYVITAQGYCRVPELAPGAGADIAILQNPSRKKDPDDYTVYEGELVENVNVGVYSIVEAAAYGRTVGQPANTITPEQSLRYGLMQTCMDSWGNVPFRYVTFSAQAPMPGFIVDGETVRRVASAAVLDVQMAYQAISGSGLVKVPRGMVPIYGAETVGDTPRSTGLTLTETYFPLRDEPVFCFALGEIAGVDPEKVEWSGVSFSCEAYGSQIHVQVYNSRENTWREVRGSGFPLAVDPGLLAECLDQSGRLFLRVTSAGTKDGEIYNPGLALEGRVR